MKNNKRSDDLSVIKKNLQEIKDSTRRVKEDILIKHNALKEVLTQSNEIKFRLLDHYNKLLKEGKDTR